jgi:hypothetical protein
MGLKEEALDTIETIDTFGVPEYFTTHLGAMEDAGGGMLRAIRCIKRNGMLIPVCTIVMPAIAVMRDGQRYQEMARKVAHGVMATH